MGILSRDEVKSALDHCANDVTCKGCELREIHKCCQLLTGEALRHIKELEQEANHGNV